MSLSPALLAAMQSCEFWDRWFWVEEDQHEYRELVTDEEPWTAEQRANLAFHGINEDTVDLITRHCRVPLVVAGGYGLEIAFSPSLGEFQLDLLDTGGKRHQLGWDDQAHWHPHVLRWEELDLIGRVHALTDRTVPHPGPVVLLFQRFAPITESETVVALPLCRAAWAYAGIAPTQVPPDWFTTVDCRGNGFEWRADPERGWVLDQDVDEEFEREAYTLRSLENVEFPFAQFNEMVAAARSACEAAVRPEWRTEPVLAIARGIASDGATDRFPVLADAMEEAGCDHPVLLAHLRDPVPARGAWVAELVLGCEWGAILRHCH